MAAGTVVCKVTGCSRCGGEHEGIEFAELERPSRLAGLTLTHWANCPTTGEPILMHKAQVTR